MSPILHPIYPIMIVDDEEQVVKSTELVLRSAGYTNFYIETDARKVLSYLEEHQVELILLDLAMPYIQGEDLLVSLRDRYPEVPIVIVTSASDVETAVRCMRLGASDYMVKPFEKVKLVCLVSRLNELSELRRENFKLRDHMVGGSLAHPEAFEHIVTQNEEIIGIFKYLESSANSTQPILISGETGVGKELFAQAVHKASGRKGPFVAVNLAGLDEIMFSDTLFGHRKGAFTGADQLRPGLIKQAEGGTLFLDEIGDLNLQSQVKLLRVLQEREYFPLGSDLPQRSEARIVMATNVDLVEAVKKGLFRKDLYYRISTHRVRIPALRERPEDISLLLDHFVNKAAESLNVPKPRIQSEIPALLENYDFPGNVRELEAMVNEAVAQSRSGIVGPRCFIDRIAAANASSDVAKPIGKGRNSSAVSGAARASNGPDSGSANRPANDDEPTSGDGPSGVLRIDTQPFPTLKSAESWLIARAMERAKNNQGVAASFLGISRQTLNAKLKSLG